MKQIDNKMLTLDQVRDLIKQDIPLVVAGDEQLLKELPAGSWIGGTIPYFMAEKGGIITKNRIYVDVLPDQVTSITIKEYDTTTIEHVYTEAPDNGFSIIIIPAQSEIHLQFAVDAPKYQEFAMYPLIGWISGIHLDDLDKNSAKVFDGTSQAVLAGKAIVMHCELPDKIFADIGIINIFKQGTGDTIIFPADGFSADTVSINGESKNFAEYIKEQDIDTRLPLVANYLGVPINISYQTIDEKNKTVDFYAPVFKGVEYKQAQPIKNYVAEFRQQIPEDVAVENVTFSCNCILNFLYSKLEEKKTAGMTGPMTFGEIAYQLLNQTMVYLTINELID